MNRVPLFPPAQAPALLKPARIARTCHDPDDPVPFASEGERADNVRAAVTRLTFRTALDRADSSSPTSSAVSTFRDPRDWRARRQAQRFRLVVKRSRQTGLYGLLDYASRRSVANGLTLDQLEDALASCHQQVPAPSLIASPVPFLSTTKRTSPAPDGATFGRQ
jgi:hypothetical protein